MTGCGSDAGCGRCLARPPPGRRADEGDGSHAIPRRRPADYLAPIDPSCPGERPPPGPRTARRRHHERRNTTGHARDLLYPAFRPVGTQGCPCSRSTASRLAIARGARAMPSRSSTKARRAARRLHIEPARSTSSSTATTCCRGVSSRQTSRTPRSRTSRPGRQTAPWTDEVSGDRRLICSDTGNGWDAARILLPDVMAISPGARRPAASSSACRSDTS